MADDIDVEKLLEPEPQEEEEKDLKPEVVAEQEKSPAKEPEGETEREKKLKRQLIARQKEIERLKAEKDEPKKEIAEELTIDENDPGVKLWNKKIEEVTKSAIKPILEANQKRAIKTFVERHPEYATPEYKSKLQELVAQTTGKVEEGEILETLMRGWGSQNWQELEKAQSKREIGRAGAQKAAARATSTGDGLRKDDDYTEEEERKAAKLGMTPDEYRKHRAAYRANSVNSL